MAARLGPIFRRVLDAFPITPAGLVVLGGAGLSLGYYGLARIDLLLLVVGVVGLALGAAALLAVLLGALIVWIRLRKGGAIRSSSSGVPARTGFALGASARSRWSSSSGRGSRPRPRCAPRRTAASGARRSCRCGAASASASSAAWW